MELCTGPSVVAVRRARGTRVLLMLLATLATVVGADPGQAADIVFISPTLPYSFWHVPVTTTSASTSFTVRNDGAVSHSILSVSLAGANPGDFGIAGGNCTGMNLAPNATCLVDVHFAPTSGGTRTAQLSVAHDAAGSPSVAAIDGYGSFSDIGVSSPAIPIAFPTVNVGSQSAIVSVTLQNVGTASVTLGSASIGGLHAADFAIATPCASATLAPGGTCTVGLRFVPTAVGSRNAALSVLHNGNDNPVIVGLVGNGFAPSTTSTTSTTETSTTSTTTTTLQPSSMDNFVCYKVRDLKNPAFTPQETVQLTDQFGASTVDVKKPAFVCAPADKDGSGVNDPVTHLCCYKLKSPKLPAPVGVQIADQFGALQLEVKKRGLLCQPCGKDLLP